MKRFPIMWPKSDDPEAYYYDTHAFYIPWELIEPHENQANINHSQTLKRLAERGGLSPIEAVAVMEDKEFPWHIGVNDNPLAVKERKRCMDILRPHLQRWVDDG